MRTVQEQLEQSLQAVSRRRKLRGERPGGWLHILKLSALLVLFGLILAAIPVVQITWVALSPPTETAMMREARKRLEMNTSGQSGRLDWIPIERIPSVVGKAMVLALADPPEKPEVRSSGLLGRFASGSYSRYIAWTSSTGSVSNQLVRNLWLGSKRPSVIFMLRERYYSSLVDRFFSELRILELYLNTLPLGPAAYGVEAGSRFHFGMSSSQLTLLQACRLAAISKDPQHRRAYEELVTVQAERLAVRLTTVPQSGLAVLPFEEGEARGGASQM